MGSPVSEIGRAYRAVVERPLDEGRSRPDTGEPSCRDRLQRLSSWRSRHRRAIRRSRQKYSLVVHAEVNAILMAGDRARGSTLYVWPSFMIPPICAECCKVAIQAGVAEIVGFQVEESKLTDRQLRWKQSNLVSRDMCYEANIRCRGIYLSQQ